MKRNLLLMIMLLSITIPSFAYDHVSGGIYYNKTSDSTVEVTYKSNQYLSYSGNVIIPEKETYNGITYSVTSIGDDAFYNCTDLTSVTIPNSVTSIGISAFYSCIGLTSVRIPNSVTLIKIGAFCKCASLKSIKISNSVKYIIKATFGYCTSLTSVTIPSSVTSIGSGAFQGCSSLTSVTIPNSVTSIGSEAFQGCSILTSVTIPNSVTSIGYDVFEDCTGLTSINVDEANYNYCSDGSALFEKNNKNILTLCGGYKGSYSIPSSVKRISEHAFRKCRGLTSVTIPNSVTFISGYTFSCCTGLMSINVDEANTKYCSDGGILFNKDKTTLLAMYGGYKGDSFIHNSVKSIEYCAFAYCKDLTSVTIPNSVVSIGSSTFEFCTGLTTITIPDSVKWIGSDTFAGCSGLTSVTIPKSVIEIGVTAFNECKSLCDIYTYISRPGTVNIDAIAFEGVDKSTCKLHVIKGTKALYQAADQWKDFKNIVDDIAVPAGIDNVQTANSFKCHADGENIYVTSDKALDGVEVYSLDGKMITRSLEKSNSYIIPIKEKACIIRSGKTAVKERLRRY